MRLNSKKWQGFSLVELSIALVIIGVLTVAGLQVYNSASYYKNQELANRALAEAKSALVNFAALNFRLPCPDTDLDGYENCTGTTKTGTLPYLSLGIRISSQIGDVITGYQNIIYGVYRLPNTTLADDADLAALKERTGNSLGDLSYQNIDDLKKAIANASLQAVVDTQPYITGDDTNTTDKDENCTNNAVINGAFWLAAAAGIDASGDGNSFDGVNTGLKHDGTGSNCFASPQRRQDLNYDDIVTGMSFGELLGQL